MILSSMQFTSVLPTQIIFGMNVVKNRLAEEIRHLGAKKVLLVTDSGLMATGLVGQVVENLVSAQIEVVTFSEVEPNPTPEAVVKGTELFVKHHCDLLVALGGGSSMDAAKSIAVSSKNPGDILDYRRGGKTVQGPLPPLIAIPTTAGTGSEVTAVSVLSDHETKRKYTVASPYIYPKIAFVDPTMTLSLPKRQIVATGMDALVHAIETFTSNRSQPISDALALQAMKMIREYLPASYAVPTNLEAKAQVMLASTIAGLAFSMSGTALVHSISRAVTSWFGVPHGIANAVLLPYVIQYNLIAQIDKYAEIARIFNEDLRSINKYKAAEKLVDEVRSFTQQLDIPNDFGYLNVQMTDQMFEEIAAATMDDRGTLPNNPRKPSLDEVIQLYKKVFPQKG